MSSDTDCMIAETIGIFILRGHSSPFEKRTSGVFGDPAGYEETLYQTEKGYYFLYVNGGAESKYKKEDIKCLSAAKANAWLENK